MPGDEVTPFGAGVPPEVPGLEVAPLGDEVPELPGDEVPALPGLDVAPPGELVPPAGDGVPASLSVNAP